MDDVLLLQFAVDNDRFAVVGISHSKALEEDFF